MGEAQSKSQSNKTEEQEKNQQKNQEKLSSSSSQSKPKNYKKIQTCINVDQFQKMLSREDPILDQEQIKQQQQQEQQEQQQQENFNVQDFINFKLVPRQNPVKLSNKEKTTVPVMISMETQAASEELPSNRSPIDLVCVIDDSGSMSGTKAKLVRKSLKYLLKILNDKDRICLITYDNNAKVLTPFLRNSENNKQELKNAIQNVQGRGGTQTITGIEHGLWMMKNRKQKNPVTCMFLLSDGVDFQGKQLSDNVASLIYDYQIKEQFTINTYGYGADHDPDVLLNIAKQKGGNFYFIENLKKVSDWIWR
ncbi:hypothetical protein PPERSA_06241 [Pseudocohnilembus persalinus]|uniref:VWFA domain-containing protein n=1 Tax=Pseudocohnilembus persalinus TaxID=266149 RepID=A0A0V0QVM7_PSEPJ|nr:hypothetical protein PPERSA_06241 [Pseudocohnilembus persalinus]|eukprot:KRX06270.1 hypothetical protein PPERSA_06241 [Pseudocohnilembus persalinus]